MFPDEEYDGGASPPKAMIFNRNNNLMGGSNRNNQHNSGQNMSMNMMPPQRMGNPNQNMPPNQQHSMNPGMMQRGPGMPNMGLMGPDMRMQQMGPNPNHMMGMMPPNQRMGMRNMGPFPPRPNMMGGPGMIRNNIALGGPPMIGNENRHIGPQQPNPFMRPPQSGSPENKELTSSGKYLTNISLTPSIPIIVI